MEEQVAGGGVWHGPLECCCRVALALNSVYRVSAEVLLEGLVSSVARSPRCGHEASHSYPPPLISPLGIWIDVEFRSEILLTQSVDFSECP